MSSNIHGLNSDADANKDIKVITYAVNGATDS